MQLQYDYTNSDFCRIYYKGQNRDGQWIHYCLQDEGIGNATQPVTYRCTGGHYKEPEYAVTPKEKGLFPKPNDGGYGDKLWQAWDDQENNRPENDRIDQTFEYSLLGRLVSDCKYCLHSKSLNHLWGLTVDNHIIEMRRLWHTLIEKPEWLKADEITALETQLKDLEKESLT